LKEQNPEVKVIRFDPVGSIFASYFQGKGMTSDKHLFEGVGKGSIPGAMEFSLIDDVLPVSDDNAFAMCHCLASHAGVLAGGGSGLNACAAIKLANQVTEPFTDRDNHARHWYLSKIYNPAWLEENGIVTGTPTLLMAPDIRSISRNLPRKKKSTRKSEWHPKCFRTKCSELDPSRNLRMTTDFSQPVTAEWWHSRTTAQAPRFPCARCDLCLELYCKTMRHCYV
jgi:hypothetical protein